MKAQILVLLLAASLIYIHAAPLIDEPVPELKLTNGRVLHDALAKSYAVSAVMIRHRDGAETIPYGLLPTDLQLLLTSKRPAPPSAESVAARKAAAEQVRLKKIAAEKSAAEARDKVQVRKGLRITSSSPSQISYMSYIEITNETENPKTLFADNFIGVLSSGITTTGDTISVKNGDFSYVEIPGNSSVKILVSFPLAKTRKESVSEVRWE